VAPAIVRALWDSQRDDQRFPAVSNDLREIGLSRLITSEPELQDAREGRGTVGHTGTERVGTGQLLLIVASC